MPFDALDVSLELVSALREPVARLERSDADLARQLRRAVTSTCLCLSEGRLREGRDRRHLFRVAAGSAAEVATALSVAEAWGYIGAAELARARSLVDRLRAMLWRLVHG